MYVNNALGRFSALCTINTELFIDYLLTRPHLPISARIHTLSFIHG